MADKTIEEKKTDTQAPDNTQAASVALTPATPVQELTPSPVEEKSTEPQKMSRGEKWYNRIVYQGINYWLNLGISLWVTDVFVSRQKGKFLAGAGKEFFDRTVNRMTKGITSTGILKHKAAHRTATIAASTFTLNSGGNILLVPTKFIEDSKRKIVHWLNKDIFHEEQRGADGHELTPDEIYIEQEQPHQSWMRMIGRRTLGLIATTGTGLIIDKTLARKLPESEIKKHENGDTITHKPGQDVFTETTLTGVNYVLNRVPGGKKIVSSPTAQRYMGYAALDWIYTVITSKILHMTNGAKKAKMPHEIGNGHTPPASKEFARQVQPYDRENLITEANQPDSENPKKKELANAPRTYAERVSVENSQPVQPSL